MICEHTTPIRRHPDGSIDTDYYLLLGRRARSRQAHDSIGNLSAAIRRCIAGWPKMKRVPGGTRAAEIS